MATQIRAEAQRSQGGARIPARSAALRETVDMGIRLSEESLTRSHGGTEFPRDIGIEVALIDFPHSFSVPPSLRVRHPVSKRGTCMSMDGREKGESLFVNRRTGERFSCRTVGARSWRFVVARSAEPLREKFINTERPVAGRLEVTGRFASRMPVGFVAPSGRLGLTQRTRRERGAKVRKDLCLVAVNSLGDLCVKAFAAFALKSKRFKGATTLTEKCEANLPVVSPRPATGRSVFKIGKMRISCGKF